MKKIRVTALVLLILIFSNILVSCGGSGLEVGYKESLGSGIIDASLPDDIAYRSDKNSFNIDDVTLEFSYGYHYVGGIEHTLEYLNIPSFKVVCWKDGEKHIVKEVEENFVSEKYNVVYIRYKNSRIIEKQFNHTEVLTIPKEVFVGESGYFYFDIVGINIRAIEPREETFVSRVIHYTVKDGKVKLYDSNPDFKDNFLYYFSHVIDVFRFIITKTFNLIIEIVNYIIK